ncbi:DUF5990 family protein [Streptoalloteichus hindustanus]|uniref:Tlm Orf7 n=1 Tax=Streptoalloteichus hindustanus TaxID=2017 RepID=A4KUD0_STRHI|nr:DUF5990 family protein [Streptoalloteichus hindustanus]ABL74958.1 Tlm Orf7 [Streptoalloteichus hindustanus]SHF86358.1 hypothetical protein SAMN05444320_105268 [Streptoalloteichus hindustanus]
MTTDERTVRVEVVWREPVDEGEVGLQDKSGELVAGTPQSDGSVRYEVDVPVRPRRGGGGLDFAGPHVHGSAGERFLYLSFRRPGEAAWFRRSKILLPESAPESAATLRATVVDVSGSRAGLDPAGWVEA